ncbi:MAG: GrpB family protein [Chloroflexota bacterium]|nr:GrpB family protein [Chloroflexota bacterium]
MSRVVIADYNPKWPTYFEEEREPLAEAFGPYALDIQHVGSTSVPGLGAKPIIDIAVATEQYPLPDELVQRVVELGFEHVGEYGVPRRHYFRRGANGRYAVHVHALERTGQEYVRHILFRDYLRAHSERTRAYEELKRHLAETLGHDRHLYTDMKTDFVMETLRLAGEWQQGRPHQVEQPG